MSNPGSLFREEAAAARNERRCLDLVPRVISSRARLVEVITVLALLMFLLWGFFVSMHRSFTIDGFLSDQVNQDRHQVVMLDSGTISELLVSHSDRVLPGTPIARQTVPDLDREIAYLQNTKNLLEQQSADGNPENAALNRLQIIEVALVHLEAQRATRSQVVSYRTGRVTEIYARTGDFLSAGSILAEIREQDPAVRHMVAIASPSQARDLNAGVPVEIEVQLSEDRTLRLPGKVIAINDAPRTYKSARVPTLPQGDGVQVSIAVEKIPDLLDVPEGTPGRIRFTVKDSTPFRSLVFGWL